MEALSVALLLAAISAVTFLAYKRPSAYAKIHYPIAVLLWGSLMGMAIWDESKDRTFVALLPYLDPATKDEARDFVWSLGILDIRIIVGGAFALVYLTFLRFLPKIRGEDQTSNRRSGSKDR